MLVLMKKIVISLTKTNLMWKKINNSVRLFYQAITYTLWIKNIIDASFAYKIG